MKTRHYHSANRIDAALFDSFYQLLSKSLPDNETRTREDQRRLLEHPSYQLFVKIDAGKVKAVLAVWEFEKLRFIEHFAVDASLRGGGIGSQMLLEYLVREDKPVVLEVEKPQSEWARRRIGFYERAGFVLNEYAYMQPPLRTGQEELPLFVMSYPGSVDLKAFEQIKKTLYKEVYGVL